MFHCSYITVFCVHRSSDPLPGWIPIRLKVSLKHPPLPLTHIWNTPATSISTNTNTLRLFPCIYIYTPTLKQRTSLQTSIFLLYDGWRVLTFTVIQHKKVIKKRSLKYSLSLTEKQKQKNPTASSWIIIFVVSIKKLLLTWSGYC